MEKSAFKAGMFLLETLTSGMYNDSLVIYREYIQNAADSIDIEAKKNPKSNKRIHIDLDPFENSITIADEGAGISSDLAESILSSIGLSPKVESKLRGFRGIGRLGGLAFCEHATFRTKAKGEGVESIQEWDCGKLRNIMTSTGQKPFSIEELFNECAKFYQSNGKKKSGSFFEVKLEGVQSFKNHVMDIKKVHDYIRGTAPVPYNPATFSYAKEINKCLKSNISSYSEYEILLNGDPIYKPYTDQVKLTHKGYDEIQGVEFFDIKIKDFPVAYGWYGKRKKLLGAIAKGQHTSGLRVRVGNIQIGGNHLLDECFREARFNSYMMGEVHVDCAELVPNSRRDDFIDNIYKNIFYNEIERKIGLPFSKEIRKQSRQSSRNKVSVKVNPELNNNSTPRPVTNEPFQENELVEDNTINQAASLGDKDLLSALEKECKNCSVFKRLAKN